MIRTLIVLPDGTEIFSGTSGAAVIASKTLTQMVNDGTELSIGSICSNMFEAKIISSDGRLTINESSEIEVYDVDDNGMRTKSGLFRVEKPSRSTAHTYKITAYDRAIKLDKDVTEWFNALDAWPYTLYDFAVLLCAECGLILKNESIPNGDRLIQKFSASGITGRQLMKYIGQACCRFGRATLDGEFEFAWYSENGRKVTAADYYADGLSYEDYVTHPIERVQLRSTESDIGTIFPQDTDGTNTYVIEGNPLLTAADSEDLLGVAETIFSELQSASYTPCKCSLFYPSSVNVGDIITITDKNGVDITAYVMKSTLNGQKQTIECFGSYRRDSVSLKNNESIVDPLYGKMLELEKTVEGVSVRVSDLQTETDREIAEVGVRADGISAVVSQQTQEMEAIKESMTSVAASASNVQILVQKMIDDGVSKVKTGMGYTFDDEGMNVTKEGDEVGNLVNNRGIHVTRGDVTMFRVNADDTEATNLKVNTYLQVPHSRFEDYSDDIDAEQTALFWI